MTPFSRLRISGWKADSEKNVAVLQTSERTSLKWVVGKVVDIINFGGSDIHKTKGERNCTLST